MQSSAFTHRPRTKRLVMICLTPIVAASPVHGATLMVTPDGTGDFPTIQAAVDAAAELDSVALTDGLFTGDGNRDIDMRGKQITVCSLSGDPRACIIDCQGGPGDNHRGFILDELETPATVIAGITVTGGWVEWTGGGGILCDRSGPTIHNCILRQNHAFRGGGLHVFDHMWGGATVTDCTFLQNTAGAEGGAACVYWGAASFLNCTMVANAAINSGGAVCCTDAVVSLDHCIVAHSSAGAAVACVDLWSTSEVSVSCSDIFQNYGGDWVDCIAGQQDINGNLWADPLFCLEQNPEAPYTLHEGSPCAPGVSPPCGRIGAWDVGCPPAQRVCCIDDACQILSEGDCVDAGGDWLASHASCEPSPCDGVYVLRADGSGDFATIQEAIDASLAGHVVELEDGVFRGEGNINLDLRGKGITIRSRSGDPVACVIDCEGGHGGGGVRRAFDIWRGEDSTSVVEGLTLQNGRATYT